MAALLYLARRGDIATGTVEGLSLTLSHQSISLYLNATRCQNQSACPVTGKRTTGRGLCRQSHSALPTQHMVHHYRFNWYCGISGLSNEKVGTARLVHVLACRCPRFYSSLKHSARPARRLQRQSCLRRRYSNVEGKNKVNNQDEQV